MYAVDNSAIGINSLIKIICTSLPSRSILVKMARLYAEVFADPPWNEYAVCEKKHYYGREVKVTEGCPKCKTALAIAYPQEETVSYIAEELKKPEGTLVLFKDSSEEVYAAGWGYVCKIEDFQTKYHTPEMQKKVVSAIKINTQNGSIFYLSEVMVAKRARNQRIATKIAMALQDKAKQGKYNLVLRTHNDSPMARIANSLGMRRIVKLGEDTEMDGRVLFLI